jgi:hypothetical protein
MRPKKPKTTEEGDLFRARLDQIINMKHELVRLAFKIDWDWIDGEIAPLFPRKVVREASRPHRKRPALRARPLVTNHRDLTRG